MQPRQEFGLCSPAHTHPDHDNDDGDGRQRWWELTSWNSYRVLRTVLRATSDLIFTAMLWGGQQEQTHAPGTERTCPMAGVGRSLSDSQDTIHYALPLSQIPENKPRTQICRSLWEKQKTRGTLILRQAKDFESPSLHTPWQYIFPPSNLYMVFGCMPFCQNWARKTLG